jgi:hypothetical protein
MPVQRIQAQHCPQSARLHIPRLRLLHGGSVLCVLPIVLLLPLRVLQVHFLVLTPHPRDWQEGRVAP